LLEGAVSSEPVSEVRSPKPIKLGSDSAGFLDDTGIVGRCLGR